MSCHGVSVHIARVDLAFVATAHARVATMLSVWIELILQL